MDEKFKSIIVSDCHIREPDSLSGRAFLQLTQFASNSSTFILLGDIFDFCFGRPQYFKDRYQIFGEALKLLSMDVSIYYIEGNHEFAISELAWDGVQFVSEDDLILNGIKYCHGDHFANEPLYQLFRKFIKSNFIKFAANLLPPKLLNWYAYKHAAISRSFDTEFDHTPVLSAAHKWLGEEKVGVFGHYHVPYNTEHSGKRLLSLDCWQVPNFLAQQLDGEFVRGIYKDEKWQIVPIKIVP